MGIGKVKEMKTNLFKKLSVMALSGLMATGLSTTAVFATDVTSIDVTKTVTSDGNTYAPNTTFTINVASGAGNEEFGNQTTIAGVTGGLTGTTFTYAPTASDTLDDEYVKNGSLTIDKTKFTEPGIYEYEVTETAGTYDGITYDTAKYYVYLYVVNGTSGLEVEGAFATLTRGDLSDEAKTTIDFTNSYTTYSATVVKEITGNQSVSTDGNTFTLSVTPSTDGEIYKVVVTRDGVATVSTLSSGNYSTQIDDIDDDDTIVIYGLSEDDTYVVTETTANTDGYTTTITSTAAEANRTIDNTAGSVTVSKNEANVIHTVTNDKDVSTPTGLFLDYAPYALIVMVAAGMGFVFFRKKNLD